MPGPLFDEYVEPELIDFEIAAYNANTKERRVIQFKGAKQLSGNAFMQLAMADDDLKRVNAYGRIIQEACYNHDGLPLNYQPDLPANELAAITEEQKKDPDLAEKVDPRYWDEEQWSSRRRFTTLFLSTEWDIPIKTIEKLAEWMMENAAERPTWKPSRSSRGQVQTATG